MLSSYLFLTAPPAAAARKLHDHLQELAEGELSMTLSHHLLGFLGMRKGTTKPATNTTSQKMVMIGKATYRDVLTMFTLPALDALHLSASANSTLVKFTLALTPLLRRSCDRPHINTSRV